MHLEAMKQVKKWMDEAPMPQRPYLMYFMDQWYICEPASLLGWETWMMRDIDIDIRNALEANHDG